MAQRVREPTIDLTRVVVEDTFFLENCFNQQDGAVHDFIALEDISPGEEEIFVIQRDDAGKTLDCLKIKSFEGWVNASPGEVIHPISRKIIYQSEIKKYIAVNRSQ